MFDADADLRADTATRVSALERGVTKGIDFATLDRLAAVLDISPGLLISTNPNGAWTVHDQFHEHNAILHQVLGSHGWFVVRERYDFYRDALVYDLGRAEVGVV